MEKEIYTEANFPFLEKELYRISHGDRNEKAKSGFFASNFESKITGNVISEVVRSLEGVIGPIYSVKKNESSPLPESWNHIVDYLNENKIISRISFPHFYYDEPKIVRTTAIKHPEFERCLDTDGHIPPNGISAHGDSEDIDESISKLIGEILERYPLAIYKNKDLVRSSISSLSKKRKFFLDPNILAGFSSEQKIKNSRFNFDNKSVFSWSEGKSLFTGKKVLIPSQLIFWNYNFNKNGWQEPMLRESNSNGAGGYYTLKESILSGLYELIQRDGFLIYWLNKLAPPIIDNDSIEFEQLKRMVKEVNFFGLEVIFLNTTTEPDVPSCICLILDNSGTGPKVSMGGGCDADWNKTLLRSLNETLCLYHFLRIRNIEHKEQYLYIEKMDDPFQNSLFSQKERLSLWGNEKMFDKIKFFIEGKKINLNDLIKKQKNYLSPEEELNDLIEKFRLLGKEYEIFYYQARHKILDDFGYYSSKVIVPALVPLYLREGHAHLGGKRLKEVPSKLGLKSAERWNPWPHPFP